MGSSRRIAILGGGISGLAAAWRLARCGKELKVVVVEGSERIGGWMQSVHTEEGAVLELGPRSLRIVGPAGKTALALVSELGLSDQVLPVPPSHKGAKRRLIYTTEHGLVELPSGPSWLFQTKPPFTRPLLGAVVREVFRKKKESSEDESVHDFISRRLGKEIADYVMDPMCRGIFAGSSRKLSVKSCFPPFYMYEMNHGSIIRGSLLAKELPPESPPDLVRRAMEEKWQIYNFRSGLQTLPDALHSSLQEDGVDVVLGQPCTRLEFTDNAVKVETANNVFEVDHVISAIPSHVLGGLLAPEHSPLSQHLLSIPSVTVGVVCLEYKGHVVPPEYVEAFGYLVPSHQQADILGVIFDSSTFPQHDRPDQLSTRCTVMLGGEWFDELGSDLSPDDLSWKALQSLEKHLGITEQPSHIVSKIHRSCIPQYLVGHSSILDGIYSHIEQHRLPLSLTGLSYKGVSVNDCIHNAVLAAEKIL